GGGTGRPGGPAGGMWPGGRGGGGEAARGLGVGGGGAPPIGPDGLPAVAQPLLIGIAVLRDDCRDALGMPGGDAKSRGGAVVEDVEHEEGEPDRLGEAVDDVG